MIKKMAMENSIGRMGKPTKVNGKMENNMDRVLLLIRMEMKLKLNGLREKKLQSYD